MKYLIGLLIVGTLSGCSSFSATALRCGTDKDSSYVELAGAPQHVASSTRAFAELCGFAYDEGVISNETP